MTLLMWIGFWTLASVALGCFLGKWMALGKFEGEQ